MGVIFRNGRPYGAQEKDVTTVATVADLADLASKKENHIYIVEEDNIPYRYDKTTRQFYPLSSSSEEIVAQENQLIVGDGENWAKGNVNGYYTVFSQDSVNLLGTTTNLTGGAAFGNIRKQNNQYSLINGFKSRDTGIMTIQGMSDVTIGEAGRDYSSTSSNVYSFWDGAKNYSPKINMSGTAQFQMIGGTKAYSKPVISMIGDSVIEMNAYDWGSSSQGSYTRNRTYLSSDSYKLSIIAYYAYQNTDSPFGGKLKDSAAFPYLRMNNSSTILMEGASLIKMADGAGVEITGNAEVSIRGGGGSTTVDGMLKTGINIEPGVKIKMSKDSNTLGGNFGPFFSMESGHDSAGKGSGKIVLTCAHDLNDKATVFDYPTNVFDLNQIYANNIIDFTKREYQYGERLCCSIVSNSLGGFCSGMEQSIFQPTFKVEGRTHISIGDGGCFAAKIGPGTTYDMGTGVYKRGYTQFDWTDKGDSCTQIKIGTGEKGRVKCHIGTEDASTGSTIAYYKICPEKNSETSFNFTPGGTNSWNYSPHGLTNVTFIPHTNTDITIQTDTMYMDIEGYDTFIQATGNFHIENHAGTSILRSTYSRGLRTLENGHRGLDWSAPVGNRESDAPVSQLYDGSNFCMIGEGSNFRYGYYDYTTSTQQTQEDFEASQEYADIVQAVEDSGCEFLGITYFRSALSSGTYKNNVTYKYIYYIPNSTTAPVLEMRNVSELRLRDGVSIYARNSLSTNEPGIEVVLRGKENNIVVELDRVELSIAELKALKNLIVNPPLAPAENQSF